MSKEQLISAFQELQVFMEALMSDEIDESAIDWDTVDREYVFKNVLGQDIIALFESLDSEGILKLLGGVNPETYAHTGLMTNPSIINYISMRGYDIKKGSSEGNESISFVARDANESYYLATPACFVIAIDSDTETGGMMFYIKGIPQIITEGYIRFKKCPILSEYKLAFS